MSVTQDYIDQENASTRRPVELFHLWRGSNHWRYTSGDVDVSYDGYTWSAATINRGKITWDSDLKASDVDVKFTRLADAIAPYLAGTPLNLVAVEIYKLFRDQDPLEARQIFSGHILDVDVQGLSAVGRCAGIEYQLGNPLLTYFYQVECNHTVFDARCGLTAAIWQITPTVTVDSTGRVLTAAAIGGEADGWWTLGTVTVGDEARMIVDHTGNDITIMSPLTGFSGGSVTILPGCDGAVDTCNVKFSNLDQFLGFPFAPLDNPAAWVGK